MDACNSCDNGKYQALTGQSDCDECKAGMYTATNTSKVECLVCSAGMYQDENGKINCKQCVMGKFTLSAMPRLASYHDSAVKCVLDSFVCPFDNNSNFFNLTQSCTIREPFEIDGNVFIVGHGNNITITNPGFPSFFRVLSGSKLNLENLKMEAKYKSGCSATSTDHLCIVNGIDIDSNGTLFAKNVAVTGTRDQFGGAIYGREKAKIVLYNCNFFDNRAIISGSVLYVEKYAQIDIRDCKFSKNQLLFDAIMTTGWLAL